MMNKEKKDLFDLNIIHSSMLGAGIIMTICIAFSLKLTLFSLLVGIMMGGLINSFVNILIMKAQHNDLKFRHEIDTLMVKELEDHLTRIRELENKIEELEEGRH